MKVGRNEPCPCGSGKKYKQCCERKRAQREKFQDSLLKGLMIMAAPLLVVAVVAIVVSATSSEDDAGPSGRVWSAAHGHWHAVLPDGSEVEVKPGQVWSPEHGHFHDAETGTESVRSHVEDDLAHHLAEIESEPRDELDSQN